MTEADITFAIDRFGLEGGARIVLPIFAVLVLLAPFTPVALESIAALTALSVLVRNYLARQNGAVS